MSRTSFSDVTGVELDFCLIFAPWGYDEPESSVPQTVSFVSVLLKRDMLVNASECDYPLRREKDYATLIKAYRLVGVPEKLHGRSTS